MNSNQIILPALESPKSLVVFHQESTKEPASKALGLHANEGKDPEAITRVRNDVSSLNKLKRNVREHDQNILNNFKLSEQVMMRARNLKGDADAALTSIQKAIKSIDTTLLEYIKKAHQEEFNTAKYQPDLDQIQQYAKSIYKFEKEAAGYVESLDLILLENNLQYRTETSDKDLNRCLELNEEKRKKKEEYDAACEKVVSLSLELKQAQTIKEESVEKSEEITKAVEFDDLSLKDFQEKQKSHLEKRLETIEKVSVDDEVRVKFLEAKGDQFANDILNKEMNLSMNERINDLSERLQQAKRTKEDSFKEYEAALQERKKLFDNEIKNKSESRLSLSHFFNLYNPRTEFKKVVGERRIALNNLKNFLGMIAEEAKTLEKHLKLAKISTRDLIDNGVFDIIVETYCTIDLKFEPKRDFQNMKKIACYILGIQEKDEIKISRIEMLLNALHPRELVIPDAEKELHIGAIRSYIMREYSEKKQRLEDEAEELNKEIESSERKKDKFEDDISFCTRKIEKLDKELRNEEKEVRRLSRLQQKKLSKKEKQTQDQENDHQDEDDDNEDKLEDLIKEVESMKKNKDELPKKIELAEEKIESLEEILSETKQAIKNREKDIRSLEREFKKDLDEISNYYFSLRAELLPRIRKYVNSLQIGELKVFHEKVYGRLISPLNAYFESTNNNALIQKTPLLSQGAILGDP